MPIDRISNAYNRRSWTIVLVLAVIPATGCGDSSGVGRTYPVAGKVMLDAQPLISESGVVLFHPDQTRGNQSRFEPAGNIDEEGTYALMTKGKEGAPAGWYKIVVTALGDTPEHAKSPRHRPVARSLVPSKYGSATSSDLAVEVVASPEAGAYDLNLKGK
jgi:hypothetical protein